LAQRGPGNAHTPLSSLPDRQATDMTGIIKKVTEFYKKDECTKYYKLGKTLGT
jgi:hypothetical protein